MERINIQPWNFVRSLSEWPFSINFNIYFVFYLKCSHFENWLKKHMRNWKQPMLENELPVGLIISSCKGSGPDNTRTIHLWKTKLLRFYPLPKTAENKLLINILSEDQLLQLPKYLSRLYFLQELLSCAASQRNPQTISESLGCDLYGYLSAALVSPARKLHHQDNY